MTKIAFLATGDEITNGEITNTNSPAMADLLFNAGFTLGQHLCCSDREIDIANSLEFLLANHQIIIITGGLGPTSDDRTRYALATVTKYPLYLDENSLQAVIARLASVGLTMTEGNRQQALFPTTATILPNPNGSAPGCWLWYQDKILVMLPGPPNECLPLFTAQILPLLKQHFPPPTRIFKRWRLFAVSEGHIAEEMERLVAGVDCLTGYRFHRPYLDCKIHLYDASHAERILHELDTFFKPYIICAADTTASAECRTIILPTVIHVLDCATSGALASAIIRPSNRKNWHFLTDNTVSAMENLATHATQKIALTISGLTEYWEMKAAKETTLTLTYATGHSESRILPLRGEATLCYAVEFAAMKLAQLLKSLPVELAERSL